MENEQVIPVQIIGNADSVNNLTITNFVVNPFSIADQTNPKLESAPLGNDTTFEYREGDKVYFNQWKTIPTQNEEQTLEWLKQRFLTEGLYFLEK